MQKSEFNEIASNAQLTFLCVTSWFSDMMLWVAEVKKREKVEGGGGRCFVLNKDKKFLTSAINTAAEIPVSKTVFTTILSVIQITTKVLPRLVYGASKCWYKRIWEMIQ